MMWNLHVVIVNPVLLSVMECSVMITSPEVTHVHNPGASQVRMCADMWTVSWDSLDVIPNVIDRQTAHNQGAIERQGDVQHLQHLLLQPRQKVGLIYKYSEIHILCKR